MYAYKVKCMHTYPVKRAKCKHFLRGKNTPMSKNKEKIMDIIDQVLDAQWYVHELEERIAMGDVWAALELEEYYHDLED